MLPNVNSTK